MTVATGDKQSYSYDTLKRLGMVTTANASGTTLFYTARSYAAGASSNQTTNRLSGFAYRKSGGGILNYNTYTYDAAGNLLSFTEGNTTHRYTYSDADWVVLLTSVSGKKGGTAFTGSYVYDGEGNPISRRMLRYLCERV